MPWAHHSPGYNMTYDGVNLSVSLSLCDSAVRWASVLMQRVPRALHSLLEAISRLQSECDSLHPFWVCRALCFVDSIQHKRVVKPAFAVPWYTLQVAVFASWLLIQYFSCVCALGEFCHKRYNFINQRRRIIIKNMRALDNWWSSGSWWFSIVACGATGLGSCQKGLQRWLAGVAEAAEPGAAEGLLVTLPALMLGPGPGLQPDGQVRYVGLLLPSFTLGSGRPAHRRRHTGIRNSNRASLFSFANFGGREVKRQIEKAHIAGKASTLTLLVDLSLVDWGPEF